MRWARATPSAIWTSTPRPQGKLADIKIRQAFLKCIPRQELVDKFAKTINPDAQILNLREFLPAQGNYQEILAQVPEAEQYNTVDLAGAKAAAHRGRRHPALRDQDHPVQHFRPARSAGRGDQGFV